MKKSENILDENADIRQKAEDMVGPIRETDEGIADMSAQKISRLIHELRVHQIELTMQNDELRRIQLELEKARDRYINLYDFAPSAYFTVDGNGMVIEANLKAADLLGMERKIMVGQMFSRFVLSDDQDIWYLHRRRLLETGDFQAFQLRMVKKDGYAFYVDLQGQTVQNQDRKSGQIRIAAVDVTDRKLMEAGLQKAHDELEQRVYERTEELEIRNQELRDFSFIASHDLQEPLRKVRTLGDMVVARSGEALDNTSRDYIRRMQDSLKNMQNLLNSLLAYSRITSETEPGKRTDLGKCVDRALSNLELLIAEKSVRIEVGELPTVDADSEQMVQLFQSLVGNAIKFQKENNIPMIKIHAEKSKSSADAYEIFVEDNGIGFEERYIGKMFLPFQRLGSREKSYPGVGMGLAICNKIAARHGGRLTATSEIDKGSVFMVTLPRERKRV